MFALIALAILAQPGPCVRTPDGALSCPVFRGPPAAAAREGVPPGVFWLADHTGKVWYGAERDVRAAVHQADSPPPAAVPAALPTAATVAAKQVAPAGNYGLVIDEFPEAEHQWYEGTGTKPRSDNGVDEATYPGRRTHLTLVGPNADATLARWRTDASFLELEAKLGPAGTDTLAVQSYLASDRMPTAIGLPEGITIEDQTGKVLRRFGSPPSASLIVQEIRRVNPDYRPARDPSGSPVFSFPTIPLDPKQATEGIVGLAFICAGAYVRKRAS